MPEAPMCRTESGKWEPDRRATLDFTDKKNEPRLSGTPYIDRHDCVPVDANHDGIDDIACFVGAGKAHGKGYSELYLTQGNGTLTKVLNHGLQKYPTLSTRIATTLKHATGSTLIFVGTKGIVRDDGKTDAHRMFINLKHGQPPYFRELLGPWIRHYDAVCAVAADVNSDGLGDLIVCEGEGRPHMYIQEKNGNFHEVQLPAAVGNWRNVRIGHVTGSIRPDLVVVEGWQSEASFMHIFQGKLKAPYFAFSVPYYSRRLPNAAPDVEILDVNNDGTKDIYVVQVSIAPCVPHFDSV